MEASFTVKDLLILILWTMALSIVPVSVLLIELDDGVDLPSDWQAAPLVFFCLAGIVYLWVVAYRKAVMNYD